MDDSIREMINHLHSAGVSQADIRKMYLSDPRWNGIKEALYNSRASVFAYIDIKNTDKIAEIGAFNTEFGLTADALERAVDGLKVDRIAALTADKSDSNLTQYNILIAPAAENLFTPGSDDSAISWLKRAKRYLTPGGRLILLVENPHSIWSIGQPCDTKYVDDSQELYGIRRAKRVARKAGLVTAHMAYVSPEYRDAWSIFTDSHLPDENEWCDAEVLRAVNHDIFGEERFECKYGHLLPPLGNDKKELIRDVLRNKEYGILAPAHIIVLEADSSPSAAIYADSMKVGEPRFKYHIFNEYEDHDILADVKKVQLDVLKKFKSICEKHGLEYYLIYGTLLGAARTGEMIAADDDIDVAMMRKDYDKFVEIASGELGDDYFLQTPSNDNAFYGGYLKLQKNGTTELMLQNWWVDCHEGISVDIFPIDEMLADEAIEEDRQRRIADIQRMLYANAYGYFRDFKDIPFLTWKACKYAAKLIGKDRLVSRLSTMMKAGQNGATDGYGIYAHYTEGNPVKKLEKKWFKETVYLPFEGELYPVPIGFSELLKARYGEMYIYPYGFDPERARHGFYDAHKPYQFHKDRLLKRVSQLPADKTIVLIGDGLLFKDFAKKYPEANVGRKINIDLCQPVRIEPFSEYPVLALADIRAGQKLLEDMSIEDYKIFVEDRELLRKANHSFWKLGKWYKENPN